MSRLGPEPSVSSVTWSAVERTGVVLATESRSTVPHPVESRRLCWRYSMIRATVFAAMVTDAIAGNGHTALTLISHSTKPSMPCSSLGR